MKRLKIYESFRTEQEIKDLCSEYNINEMMDLLIKRNINLLGMKFINFDIYI
jgi:hypothetical protein